MSEEAPPAAPPAEAAALFLVTVNGAEARAEIAAGLDAVRDLILRVLWSGAREVEPAALDRMMAGLDDPAAWAAHGTGDGRPFWHWWAGFGNGSVAVQRLTGHLPAEAWPAAARTQAAASLLHCAAALRGLARGAPAARPMILAPSPQDR